MSEWDKAQTLGKMGIELPTGTPIKMQPPPVEAQFIDTTAIATSEPVASLFEELESQVSEFEMQFEEDWEASHPEPQLSPVPEGAQSMMPPAPSVPVSRYEHPMLTAGHIKRKG